MKIFKTPVVFRWMFPLRTWGFSTSEKVVYLTFDDGPDPRITPYVLDTLKEEEIKATFFCVGENVRLYPDLYQTVLSEGHSVGNHTMRHEKGTEVSNKKYFDSIEECANLVQSDLFRPPYGRATWNQSRMLSKKYRIIMWSWLSYDYDRSVSVEEILENAKTIKNGDILVLHDNVKVEDRIRQLLPVLIKDLKERGFAFQAITFA
jgi:peptidoglycan/xylan/chitin deacetylase (PgdA/CDA1 family)